LPVSARYVFKAELDEGSSPGSVFRQTILINSSNRRRLDRPGSEVSFFSDTYHPILYERPPLSATKRPFRVLGVQQIALGSTDKARLRRLWVDLLGLTLEGSYRSERENVDEDIAVIGHGPARCEIDLMQTAGPGPRGPAVHEPALNHVGLWVDDLASAVQWLSAQGGPIRSGGASAAAAGGSRRQPSFTPRASADAPLAGEGRADRNWSRLRRRSSPR